MYMRRIVCGAAVMRCMYVPATCRSVRWQCSQRDTTTTITTAAAAAAAATSLHASQSQPTVVVANNNNTAVTATAASTSRASRAYTLDDVLIEVLAYVTRTLPIGELFRALSPHARRTLSAMRLPLEQLLLHYPDHFAVFRSGRAMRRGISVCPPHLLPSGAERLRLPPDHVIGVDVHSGKPLPLLLQGSNSSSSSSSSSSSGSSNTTTATATLPRCEAVSPGDVAKRSGSGEGDGAPRVLSTLERVQEVLMYVPNEWSSFVQLNIPREVKQRCMGAPTVRPLFFLRRYPQYFDVRVSSPSMHDFEVRRSRVLQERILLHTSDVHR